MGTSKRSISEIKTLSKGGETPEERAAKLKTQWNDFVEYLKKKGVAGRPELDSGVGENNVGVRYIRQYQKENPTTIISPEIVSEVQGHFKNYRDYAINEIQNKRASYSGDINTINAPESTFMRALSRVDGIPGQQTTSWKFPNEFLNKIYTSPTGAVERKETIKKGLAALPIEKRL